MRPSAAFLAVTILAAAANPLWAQAPEQVRPAYAVISPALPEMKGPDGKPLPASGKSPLVEMLTKAGEKVIDVSGDRDPASPVPGGARVLMIGSGLKTDRPADRLRKTTGDFVKSGGVLVILVSPGPDASASLAYLPEGVELTIEPFSHAKRVAAFTDHPLFSARHKLSEADFGGRPVGTLYAGGCFGACKGLAPVVAYDARGRYPIVVEGLVGKGRVIVLSLAPDRAFMLGTDDERISASLLMDNLRAYVAAALAGKGADAKPFDRALTGVVFEDADGNGKHDPGEKPLAGVAVSDEETVVQTDAEGRFTIPLTARSRFITVSADLARFRGPLWRRIPDGATGLDIGLIPRKAPLKLPLRIVQLVDLGGAPGMKDDPELRFMLSEAASLEPKPDLVVISGDAANSGLRAQAAAKALGDIDVAHVLLTPPADRLIAEQDAFAESLGPARYGFRLGDATIVAAGPFADSTEARKWRGSGAAPASPRCEISFPSDPLPPALMRPPDVPGTAKVIVEEGGRSGSADSTFTFRRGGVNPPPGFRVIDIPASERVRTEMRVAGMRDFMSFIIPGDQPAAAGTLPAALSLYDTRFGADVPVRVELARMTREKNLVKLEPVPEPDVTFARTGLFTRRVSGTRSLTVKEGLYVIRATASARGGQSWQKNASFTVERTPLPKGTVRTPWLIAGGDDSHTGESKDAADPPYGLAGITSLGVRAFHGSPAVLREAVVVAEPWWNSIDRDLEPKRSDGKTPPALGLADVAYYDSSPLPVVINLGPFAFHRAGVFHFAGMRHVKLETSETPRRSFVFAIPEAAPRLDGAQILVAGEFLFVVSDDGHAWCFSRTQGAEVGDGNFDWKKGSEALQWSAAIRPGCRQAVATDVELFTGNECLDASKGTVRWKLQDYVLSDANVALAGGSVVISGVSVEAGVSRQMLLVVERDTGRVLWSKELAKVRPGDEVLTPAPALSRREVFIGSADGTFRAMNLQTGAELWSFRTGPSLLPLRAEAASRTPRISSAATVSGPHVFFGAYDGKVYCMDRKLGKVEWSASAGAPILAQPVITGDVLYVVDWDGNLCTFVSAGEARR